VLIAAAPDQDLGWQVMSKLRSVFDDVHADD